MAVGFALTLLSALILQSIDCPVTQDAAPFLRLVNLYRHGHANEATQELRKLNPRFVERVVEHQGSGTSDVCLEAASLLETELAMAFAVDSRWKEADSRFDNAWQLSFFINETADRVRFQRDWLLAAGLFHHQLIFDKVPEEAFSRSHRFLKDAARRYPDDPEVLLALGALLEWSGSLRRGDPAHLKEAEELYARALRLSPADPEILLRHGSVLEKLGSEEGASASFHRVLELDGREDLIYRSRMGLGRIEERRGRLTDAIAFYQAAADTIPSWQIAFIALGHALHDAGAHDRAREALDRALILSPAIADETLGGWWGYELGIAPRLGPLFKRMRAEVMQ